MKYLGGCESLQKDFPDLKWHCCSSCHTDDDYGYELSCVVTTTEGEYEVCCTAPKPEIEKETLK